MLEEIKKPFYAPGASKAPGTAPDNEDEPDKDEDAEQADEQTDKPADEPKKPKQSDSAIARNSLRSRASKLREQLLASGKQGAETIAEAIGAENDPSGAYGKSVQAEISGDKDAIEKATNELAQAVYRAKFHLEKKPANNNDTQLEEETGDFHQERSDILVATQAMQQKLIDAWDAAKEQDPAQREKIVKNWINGRWNIDLDDGMRSSLEGQTIGHEDGKNKMSVTFTNGQPIFQFELEQVDANQTSTAQSGTNVEEQDEAEKPQDEEKRLNQARAAWGKIESAIKAKVATVVDSSDLENVAKAIMSSTKETYRALGDEQKRALAKTTYIYGREYGENTAINFPASGYSESIEFKFNEDNGALNESPEIEEKSKKELEKSGKEDLQQQFSLAIDNIIEEAKKQNKQPQELENKIVGDYIRHAYLAMDYPQKDALKGQVVTCEHKNVKYNFTLPQSGYNPNEVKIEKV